eukprot:5086849-Amphidinium_carterae.1
MVGVGVSSSHLGLEQALGLHLNGAGGIRALDRTGQQECCCDSPFRDGELLATALGSSWRSTWHRLLPGACARAVVPRWKLPWNHGFACKRKLLLPIRSGVSGDSAVSGEMVACTLRSTLSVKTWITFNGKARVLDLAGLAQLASPLLHLRTRLTQDTPKNDGLSGIPERDYQAELRSAAR